MLSRVTEATNKVNTALRNYMFKDYADAIYDLFWRDFCDWYLESIKPTIAESPTQAAVLRNVIDAILRLMPPVMPYITETLFERFESLPMREIEGFKFEITRSTDTLCQTGWPMPDDELRDVIARNPNVSEFRRMCLERGMKSLRQDGINKASTGLTSVQEVLRVTSGH